MNEDTPVGQRIRYWRKRRKLSQATLAGLVGRSVSWIEKVERGDRLVERVPVIIALAAALRIDPARLLGPPFELKENGAAGEPPRGVPALRRILLVPDALPPHRHPTTIDLQALNTTLERARLARYHGRYTEFGLLLPDLIADARTAVHHPDPEQARFAWAILAGAYQLAAKLCARLRENDLAWIAADRSASAAHRAGDPALVGQAVARLAHAVLVAGNSEACATVAEQGALALEKDLNTPSRIATWGHLQLVGMIAAARLDDAATERALLRRAWDAAERLPQG
ncbi:MAG: helix-turn-helix domain-containing protein, partial [Pseudonocardiaceae bacterium]